MLFPFPRSYSVPFDFFGIVKSKGARAANDRQVKTAPFGTGTPARAGGGGGAGRNAPRLYRRREAPERDTAEPSGETAGTPQGQPQPGGNSKKRAPKSHRRTGNGAGTAPTRSRASDRPARTTEGAQQRRSDRPARREERARGPTARHRADQSAPSDRRATRTQDGARRTGATDRRGRGPGSTEAPERGTHRKRQRQAEAGGG